MGCETCKYVNVYKSPRDCPDAHTEASVMCAGNTKWTRTKRKVKKRQEEEGENIVR